MGQTGIRPLIFLIHNNYKYLLAFINSHGDEGEHHILNWSSMVSVAT